MEFPRLSKHFKTNEPSSKKYEKKISYDEEIIEKIRNKIDSMNYTYEPQIKLRELHFIVFDTETTGFHVYGGDRLISIGAVKLFQGEIMDEFHQIVDPETMIPNEIEKLTGITNEDVIGKPKTLEGIFKFLEFCNNNFLVAHYADFDINFINLPIQRICKARILNPALDTMMLSYHLNPTYAQDLDNLLKKYNIENIGRHHALEDARMTAKLFNKFIEQLELERGITTIGGLKKSMPTVCRQSHLKGM